MYFRNTMQVDPVLFSCAESSFRFAVEDFRKAFGDILIERLGADLGAISGLSMCIEDLAEVCVRRPLVFVRHLSVEKARLQGSAADMTDSVVEAACAVVRDSSVRGDLAVQIWSSTQRGGGVRSGVLASCLTQELMCQGISVVRGGAEWVLSICGTNRGVSVGLNATRFGLSDWPGGQVRLSRGVNRISRSEFKLEEVFHLFDPALPRRGRALDLGASPGGWSRVLRSRGFTVWAVDPGALDPRMADDPGVHSIRMTAGAFLRRETGPFDLVVNDMRMDPMCSCRLMLDVVRVLAPDALAVVTLKVGQKGAASEIQQSLQVLERRYDLLFVRQLYHNRQEVTVVAKCRADREEGV